jgi:uncharacterized protein (DUF2252 family)
MADVIRSILDYNAGRDPDRLALKFAKMRTSPFAFLRGTCHLFYQRRTARHVYDDAPTTWVCGDLHLENFGSYKGDNGLVYFDINDFDEAVLAPCTWDLVRFLASILVAARSIAVRQPSAFLLCRTFVDAYATTLAGGKARWVERQTAEGIVRQLLDTLQSRTRLAFLSTRTQRRGRRRVLRTDGKKALPTTDAQREQVVSFMRGFAAEQPNPRFFRVLDVARRIAGTGSLGVDRYAILVEGKGSPDRNYLLDLKLALPSSLLPRLKTRQPHWKTEAHRVVGVMQRMQAVSMAFLHPVVMRKKPYVLRALQPSEDRVTLAAKNKELRRFQGAVKVMGENLAWGQLRSSGRDGSAIADELIAFGEDYGWQEPLFEAALKCAAQVEKDWRIYAQAYDDNMFLVESKRLRQ